MIINILTGGGYSEYKKCLIWDGETRLERELTAEQRKYLLKSSSAWMIRNIYDWDYGRPTNFWELITDTPRKIEELPSKPRNQIRRCFRDCEIRRLENSELVESDGYTVFAEAFKRYKDVSVNIARREDWERSILENDTSEFWGVFTREDCRLIAFAINTVKGKSVGYNTLKAIPSMMNKHYPYFGLLFEMNRHYLEELRFNYVSDGFRSVTEHSNIQPFLEKNFLFRKAYCRMNLQYAPWLGLIVKLLYPFRNLIPILKIRHILNFEEIARGKC